MVAQKQFHSYPRNCTVIRAKNCGPYACCRTLSAAEFWAKSSSVIYKVEIKESKAKFLWIDNTEATSIMVKR